MKYNVYQLSYIHVCIYTWTMCICTIQECMHRLINICFFFFFFFLFSFKSSVTFGTCLTPVMVWSSCRNMHPQFGMTYTKFQSNIQPQKGRWIEPARMKTTQSYFKSKSAHSFVSQMPINQPINSLKESFKKSYFIKKTNQNIPFIFSKKD